MKIFIISIEDDSSPRLKKFLSQPFFQHGQVPCTKIGIKGGELTAKEYFAKAVKGRKQPLSPGELGCTLSHLKALQTFLASDDQYALIFEDDAIFPSDFSFDQIEQQLQQLQLPGKMLFSLGGIQMKESRKVRGNFTDFKFLGRKVLEVSPDYYHRVNYTMAYIVDRTMAETLLAYHQPLRRADDWSCLFDYDSKVHLFMTYVVDHPVIEKGEENHQLSAIEAERVAAYSLQKSRYGGGWRRNIVKLFSSRYF